MVTFFVPLFNFMVKSRKASVGIECLFIGFCYTSRTLNRKYTIYFFCTISFLRWPISSVLVICWLPIQSNPYKQKLLFPLALSFAIFRLFQRTSKNSALSKIVIVSRSLCQSLLRKFLALPFLLRLLIHPAIWRTPSPSLITLSLSASPESALPPLLSLPLPQASLYKAKPRLSLFWPSFQGTVQKAQDESLAFLLYIYLE